MFTNTLLPLALAAVPFAAAFPHLADQFEQDGTLSKRVGIPQGIPFPEWPGAPTHALYNKFDAKSQLVSTSGEHAYQAPGVSFYLC